MTSSLSSLFYYLAQECAQSSGIRIQRSHIYQLVAAAMGYGSWESFRMHCALTDGVGDKPPLMPSSLTGRANQLGLNGQSEVVVGTLIASLQQRDIRALKLSELSTLFLRHGKWPVNGFWEYRTPDHPDDWDSADEDFEVDDAGKLDWLAALRTSKVLHASLSERLASGDQTCHLWLAALLRCQKPNSYLQNEAARGRLLNITEQGMRDKYLQDLPKFEQYCQHLKAAAESGDALAAIECALALGEDKWLANADFQNNPELLLSAAENCQDEERATSFLLRGSELGHQQALEHLAAAGHPTGIEHLAKLGNRDSLLSMAMRALDAHDHEQAWLWQAVAQEYDHDLQHASAIAYHFEGPHADEPYDDDMGGPAYVLELELIELPPISTENFIRVRQRAQSLISGYRSPG